MADAMESLVLWELRRTMEDARESYMEDTEERIENVRSPAEIEDEDALYEAYLLFERFDSVDSIIDFLLKWGFQGPVCPIRAGFRNYLASYPSSTASSEENEGVDADPRAEFDCGGCGIRFNTERELRMDGDWVTNRHKIGSEMLCTNCYVGRVSVGVPAASSPALPAALPAASSPADVPFVGNPLQVLTNPTSPFYHQELWTGGREALPEGCFRHGGCGPEPYGDFSTHGFNFDQIQNPKYLDFDSSCGQDWIRIPNTLPYDVQEGVFQSSYGPVVTDKRQCIRGWHRTRMERLMPCFDYDWHTQKNINFPGIGVDGFARCGINSGQARGVWFFLHFLHPWKPSGSELVLELAITHGAIHNSSSKHHMKYCAKQPFEDVGTRSKFTHVLAIHVPYAAYQSFQDQLYR